MNVGNDIDRGGSYVLTRAGVDNLQRTFAFRSRENAL
jgi:hypothetical protein